MGVFIRALIWLAGSPWILGLPLAAALAAQQPGLACRTGAGPPGAGPGLTVVLRSPGDSVQVRLVSFRTDPDSSPAESARGRHAHRTVRATWGTLAADCSADGTIHLELTGRAPQDTLHLSLENIGRVAWARDPREPHGAIVTQVGRRQFCRVVALGLHVLDAKCDPPRG